MDSVEDPEIPQSVTSVLPTLASIPERRGAWFVLLGLTAFLLTCGNLPWHLDNYDQAKQAYVAFEIEKTGEWLYQSTPQGRSASKPPLMGWISWFFHKIGLPWDFAFRLPSLACAVAMTAILVTAGRQILGQAGAFLSLAAFALNLLTPRLATLVRTDMMLAFWIFVIGWMIYEHLRTETPWRQGDRWVMFGAMLAALFTKGPVIYVFLLPGLVAFLFFEKRKEIRRLVWSGTWTWLIPLAFFLAWAIYGLWSNAQFYEDVVVRELLSRFQEGSRDDERPQPFWFYLPHIIHKFAPWSLALIVAPIWSRGLRDFIRSRPALLWLVLWALGGLILMTIIPAKRVDRIYPVVPPLCLLTVEITAYLWTDLRVRATAGTLAIAAALFSGVYFAGLIPWSYATRTTALVDFAADARVRAREAGIKSVTILRARDEALLIYLDQFGFVKKEDGFDVWKSGKPIALLMSSRTAERFQEEVGPVSPALESEKLVRKNEDQYLLFIQQ